MATAHSSDQFVAGLGITGFGGGFCQMAMCAIPELMPNKYRHIGICLSDGFVYVIVVIGPIVGRVSRLYAPWLGDLCVNVNVLIVVCHRCGS